MGNLSICSFNVGIKRYPASLSDIDKFRGHINHIEIMAIPKMNYSKLHRLDVPVMIHNAHTDFGFNPCDLTLSDQNKRLLDFSFSLADEFSSKIIVVHPGSISNKNCSIGNAYSFFSELNDKRIHMENLPSSEGVFSSFESMRQLFNNIKIKKMCFDIGHAFRAALISKASDSYEYVNRFFLFEPKYFHFSGIDTSNGSDHHNFSNNTFDFSKILNFMPKNATITLETNYLNKTGEYNTSEQMNDICFVKGL